MFVWKYVVVIMIVFFIAFGQLLFKQSAMGLKAEGVFSGLLFNPVFILSLAIYGLATFAWIWVLQSFPLPRIYPFFALSFVFVPILSFLWFKDSLSLQYMLGVALICLGIVVTLAE